MAEPFVVPPELANTYWGQLVSAQPALADHGRIPSARGMFSEGSQAPKPGQLTPQMLRALQEHGGTAVNEKEGQKLVAAGWTYGDPAPKGFVYDQRTGLLRDQFGFAEGMGQVGLASIPLVATALTAGAASPYLAAAVGGGASLAATKAGGGSWKQALIAGGLGAAAGGIGASALSTPAKVAGQAGVGAVGGAQNGGGLRGALAGAAVSGGSAAANAAMAPKGGGTMPGTGTTGAAPATGSLTDYLVKAGIDAGTSMASKVLSGAQAAGQAAGNAAGAREAGRKTEGDNIITQDQQRLQASTAKENAVQGRAGIEIDQRAEGRAGTNDAYKNALLSALAMNMQDVSINRPKGVPHMSFSGGARPSAIGPQGREAGALLNAQSMDALRNPQALTQMPAMESFTPKELPKSNGVDTALNVGGVVGDLLAGYSANKQAGERSSLIDALLKQSQAAAAGGIQQPAAPAAPQAPSVQDDIDAINERLARAGGYA
jgi:hypothetical protein